jgi:5-methylcytosine-specific restriction endonuclease McrA
MMIKRPRPKIKLSKREIFRRDNYTCQYCGQQTKQLTVDHVLPRRLGGSFSWENLVTACPKCNHIKGGRTIEQANMILKNRPSTPSASAHNIFGRYIKANKEWEDFIIGW